MAATSGLNTIYAFGQQVDYLTQAPAGSGRILRRDDFGLELKKDTFASGEVRSDRQRADMRHGMRKVDGAIKIDLTPGNSAPFVAAALNRDFTATSAVSGASITITGTGPTWTISRASGSFLADGITNGKTIRLTAGAFNAANLNKNITVLSATAAVLTVVPVMAGGVLVAEGPIAGATVSVPGKSTFAATTGHTDRFFSFEAWQPDMPTSELYVGCAVSKISIDVPTSGIITTSFDIVGRDMVTSPTQYFTAPAQAIPSSALASFSGLLRFGAAQTATMTSLKIDIACQRTGVAVIASPTFGAIAPGEVLVSGQFSAIFDSTAHRDAFLNENELSLYGVFAVDNTAGSEFVSVSLHRIKYKGYSKSGKESIVQTIQFEALLNITGGTGAASEYSTIVVQDSQAA